MAIVVAILVAPGANAIPSSVPLTRLPEQALAHCERSGLLRPVCPRLAPRVPTYRSSLAFEQAGEVATLDVFSLESGAEYPRDPERNRPPAMAHIVATSGRVELLTPFRDPRGISGIPIRDGIMRQDRARPVPFGSVHWAGRAGVLYLAPPFPSGGMLGDHLVFTWPQHGQLYSLSLHAWEPLTESVATLRAMVDGLPSVHDARRLRLLSPVRRISMARGPQSKRVGVVAPWRGRRAFEVFVLAPGRSDISVSLRSSEGGSIAVVDTTRGCSLRTPLRVCFVLVPRERAPRGGRWTILLTKRSDARARVRIDLRLD